MKVILLKDVKNIGLKYDIKEVAGGFAHNYLIPRSLAENATKDKLKKLEVLRAQIDADRKVQNDLLAKNLDALKDSKIELRAKANDKGHLFKGIHIDEIVKALSAKKHINITADMIELPKPIKEVGEFPIKVSAGDSKVSFNLIIEAS